MILDGHFKKPIILSYIRFWGENKWKISGPSWWRIRKNWKSHITSLTGMKRSGMKGGLHSLQSSILFLTEKRGRRSMAREDENFILLKQEIRKNLADWPTQEDKMTPFLWNFLLRHYINENLLKNSVTPGKLHPHVFALLMR